MSTNRVVSPLHAAVWIGRGVLIELLRRKDAYVLGLLMLVFCVGALAIRLSGVERPATATFILNLGMTLAYVFAHTVTLLLAARQIPAEIENRTMYPILARPVARRDVLLGKWFACACSGTMAYCVFFLMVWLTAPRLESCSTSLLMQTLALQVTSLGLTASLALLLSLLVPKGVAILLLATILFFGSTLVGFIRSAASSRVIEPMVNWVVLYVPDFSKLNLTTRYTDGMSTIGGGVFAGLVALASLYTLAGLTISHRVFRRRPL
jgi:ABC-type transport system involved in multi-copper enzyme maturation permease subunit